jgi:hypothetical protein
LEKYPKLNNELHTRPEIRDVRNTLQRKGLLFQIRNEIGIYFDVLSDELAEMMRSVFGIAMRRD